jgi:hypothetical protein
MKKLSAAELHGATSLNEVASIRACEPVFLRMPDGTCKTDRFDVQSASLPTALALPLKIGISALSPGSSAKGYISPARLYNLILQFGLAAPQAFEILD